MEDDIPADVQHNDQAEETGGGATANERDTPEGTNEGGRAPRERCRRNGSRERQAQEKNSRKTKAAVTIGSLNICGRGNIIGGQARNNKWAALNQVMRERKIGVLAIQEAHLTDDTVEDLHKIYGRRMRIYHNTARENANTSQGTAIVLNREIVDIKNVEHKVLIPGRAHYVTIHWHRERQLSILNVYGPNDTNENTEFWTSIENKLINTEHTRPDVILGDFNVVEDPLDRIPAKEDHAAKVLALKDMMAHLGLQDGWRITEPNKTDFTFPQNGATRRSRLDRIYTSEELLQQSTDWRIENTAVPTDHRMASVKLSAAEAPFIGKGRWTIPLNIISDQEYMERVIEMGRKTQQKLNPREGTTLRTEELNPQIILWEFKKNATDLAKKIMKKRAPKLSKEILKKTKRIEEIQQQPGFRENDALQQKISSLQNEVLRLELRKHHATKETVAARYLLNAEIPTKYWSAINKEKKPRDIWYSVKIPASDPPRYENRSDKMAELARNYHDEIQKEGEPDNQNEQRQEALEETLETIKTKVPETMKTDLKRHITRGEIQEALRKANKGKAAGVDGIPYEFWDKLNKIHDMRRRTDKPSLDCLDMLHQAYLDIEENGVSERTGFADGWMCPIYKKGDRREIANYRPITLLNTDYKLYTRALTTKLVQTAQNVIHPDQAGFIPGRHIENQTQLCRTMVDYAEAAEEDGVIIALDQEKAYDKIDHEYMWKVLEQFEIPDQFINRVKQLYSTAHTVVIINGETSTAFKITRGVRQGDPLSCLLFNLAIEPLACMLRKSNIRGFSIPGATERIITSLFADDTSAFLSRQDKWTDLWRILQTWCKASKAKFNNNKTEVIPIGTREYRKKVAEKRRIDPGETTDEEIPPSVKIAKDGEATRILGAWIGNDTDEAAIWTPALTKISKFLKRWGQCRPSMKGKRHIVQMGPRGISQYLAKVQGMSTNTEKAIENLIRDFVWDGKKPPISMDTLGKDTKEGGIKLLDIASRNEAIELTWLKSYLTLDSERPKC